MHIKQKVAASKIHPEKLILPFLNKHTNFQSSRVPFTTPYFGKTIGRSKHSSTRNHTGVGDIYSQTYSCKSIQIFVEKAFAEIKAYLSKMEQLSKTF